MQKILMALVVLFSVNVANAQLRQASWEMKSGVDLMTDAQTLEATLISSDEGPRSKFVLKGNGATGLTIALQTEQRHIVCPLKCKVAIRFDATPPISLRAANSSDLDPSAIRLLDHPTILARLRGSKVMLIEMTYEREGKRIARFETANFVWPQNGTPLPGQGKGPVYQCIEADFTKTFTDIRNAGASCKALDLPSVK